MNLFDFQYGPWMVAFLIFVRIATLIALLPIFGNVRVPIQAKILLASALTLVVWDGFQGHSVVIPEKVGLLIWMIAKEVGIGIVMGFVARLFFSIADFAGQFAGMQIGFGTVGLIDPQSNDQVSSYSQFYTILATLVFFALDGHVLFLSAIHESFRLIPFGGLVFKPALAGQVNAWAESFFSIAFRIAAPVTVVNIFVNLALAFISRTIPQINIFIISFPVNILVGLIVLLATLPLIVEGMGDMFVDMSEAMAGLMKGIS